MKATSFALLKNHAEIGNSLRDTRGLICLPLLKSAATNCTATQFSRQHFLSWYAFTVPRPRNANTVISAADRATRFRPRSIRNSPQSLARPLRFSAPPKGRRAGASRQRSECRHSAHAPLSPGHLRNMNETPMARLPELTEFPRSSLKMITVADWSLSIIKETWLTRS